MNGRKTIQNIADDLGLSRVAVSSVINGKEKERGISKKTAERIRAYIEESGFVPSASARQLRAGGTESIGILHSGQLYSHLTDAFNRFTDYYVGKDKNLEIVLIPHDKIVQGVRELISRGVSQLIWIQTKTANIEFAAGDQLINMLKQVQTVIYNYHEKNENWNRDLESTGINCVGIDRIAGFKVLADFLKETGNNNVVLGWTKSIAPEYHIPFENNGMNIYWLEPNRRLNSTKKWGEGLADNFYKHPARKIINAICTIDDMTAGYLIKALMKKGLSIPDDVTVTGLNGMDFCDFMGVPLTTLAVPVDAMVKKTITLLSNKSKGKMFKFNPELILRESHKSR